MNPVDTLALGETAAHVQRLTATSRKVRPWEQFLYGPNVDVQDVSSTSMGERIASLESAVAARDRFISAVGHELRNLMAPLVLLADAALQTAGTSPPDRRTQLLLRNLEALTRIVDRVSDVAQLRSEKLVLELADVEIGALLREVVAEHEAAAAAAGVEVRLDASTLDGRWDARRLRQIASHLIGNAIRHSGSPIVEVTARGDAQHVELLVADRGRGIAADRLPHLFDAFDLAETTRNGGLGVGLWMVSTLCQRFGGSVSLVEDHAPGACFRVVLPRV